MERFHQIDGLRGVAITLVVMLHCLVNPILDLFFQPPWPWAANFLQQAAASGVDLFFVISGIVLLRPYLQGGRPLAVRRYFARRIIRLWPPYLAALLLTALPLGLLALFPALFPKTVGLSFNFLDIVKQLVIINVWVPTYNITWWSLNIELFFYAMVPFVILSFNRIKDNRLVLYLTIILLIVISEYIYRFYRVGIPNTMTVRHILILFMIYAPCFCFGVLLSIRIVEKRVGYVFIIAGIIYAIIASRYYLNHHNGFGMFYFGLTIVSFDKISMVYRWLSTYFMVWLGERSYSLFLIHLTAYNIVKYFLSCFFALNVFVTVVVSITGILASLLAAMVIFYVVERRFARGLITAGTFWYRPQSGLAVAPVDYRKPLELPK